MKYIYDEKKMMMHWFLSALVILGIVASPLMIILNILDLKNGGHDVLWICFFIVDSLILAVAFFSAVVFCEQGLKKTILCWKCAQIYYGSIIVRQTLHSIICLLHGVPIDWVSYIVSLVVSILVILYYKKRKPLFANEKTSDTKTQSEEKPGQQI